MGGRRAVRIAGLRAVAGRHPDAVIVAIVLAVALAFKLGFALRIPPFIAKDSQAYFLPAWDLIHSGDLQLGLRRTPGYPFFLAGSLLLTGNDLRGILLLQHLLGAGTAGLTCVLGRLTFGRNVAGRGVGLFAGLLVGVSAPLVVYEHYLLAECLLAFVTTGMLVTLVWAWRLSGRHEMTAMGFSVGETPSTEERAAARRGGVDWGGAGPWLLGGLLLGIATLVKPIAQAFLPLAVLAVYTVTASWHPLLRRGTDPHPRFGAGALAWPAPTRTALVALGALLAGYAMAVAPWTIRNRLEHDLSAPSTFGRTLIARTATYDRGFAFADPGRAEADPLRARAIEIVEQGAQHGDSDGTIAQRLRQELALDPVEVNGLMRDLALSAIERQPLYFATGSLAFAQRIFSGADVKLRDHEAERKDVVWEERTRPLLASARSDDDGRFASQRLRLYQPADYAPLPLILFALGLVACGLHPHWRPGLFVGGSALVLVLASAALNGPQERYRYPVDPAITVVAVGGAVGLGLLLIRRARPAVRAAARTRGVDGAAADASQAESGSSRVTAGREHDERTCDERPRTTQARPGRVG
ncbi:MAG: Rpn family recombination-promoting nuclease/putative transposase [Chloroflexi bacterium]|nr:Rpn family recombination-promoting nuclease/putative transposase [Chloroflexota bacterium]